MRENYAVRYLNVCLEVSSLNPKNEFWPLSHCTFAKIKKEGGFGFSF